MFVVHRAHFFELFNKDSKKNPLEKISTATTITFATIVKAIPSYLNMTLVEQDADNFATFYGKYSNGEEVVMYTSYKVSLAI